MASTPCHDGVGRARLPYAKNTGAFPAVRADAAWNAKYSGQHSQGSGICLLNKSATCRDRSRIFLPITLPKRPATDKADGGPRYSWPRLLGRDDEPRRKNSLRCSPLDGSSYIVQAASTRGRVCTDTSKVYGHHFA